MAWGLFHLRLYNKEVSRGFGLPLRSVTLYLLQPVAAAIKLPICPHSARLTFQNRLGITLASFSLDGDMRPVSSSSSDPEPERPKQGPSPIKADRQNHRAVRDVVSWLAPVDDCDFLALPLQIVQVAEIRMATGHDAVLPLLSLCAAVAAHFCEKASSTTRFFLHRGPSVSFGQKR